MPVQPGPIGAASAMKMSYAGITKGFTALGAAMMLAATRAGTADDAEAGTADQPAGAGRLAHPADAANVFQGLSLGRRNGGDRRVRRRGPSRRAQFYQAAARLYERIAADYEGAARNAAMLDAFCKPQEG